MYFNPTRAKRISRFIRQLTDGENNQQLLNFYLIIKVIVGFQEFWWLFFTVFGHFTNQIIINHTVKVVSRLLSRISSCSLSSFSKNATFLNQALSWWKGTVPAMVRTYTGHTGCVSMIFKRHHWGPQAVYQAEKPGAPESETQKKGKKKE